MKTLKFLAVALMMTGALGSGAFPFFGDDSSSTNKPPKLHVLLQGANDLIEEAQMCELNGDADGAIKNYEKALEELNKVAREYPDRAMTAEFAPLRSKATVCTTQIDNIKFEQIKRNERKMAVTSTEELQKEYNRKHGITNDTESVAATEPVKKPQPEKVLVEDLLEDAKDAVVSEDYVGARRYLVAALKQDPDNWDARFLLAYVNVASRDYTAAEMLFADMLADRPNDVPTLLLCAAAQTAVRNFAAAQRNLEIAIRANRNYYAGYYNMALLLLEMNASQATARKFYEAGRNVGGPRDVVLERRLGI